MVLLVSEDFVANGAFQNTCRAWLRDEASLQGRGTIREEERAKLVARSTRGVI